MEIFKTVVKQMKFDWSHSMKSLRALTLWRVEPSEKLIYPHSFWPIELSLFYRLTDPPGWGIFWLQLDDLCMW